MGQFDAEWQDSERRGNPLSVLMIDIDHFKHLNDGNDHLVGDAALSKLATTLLRNTRGIDTVARFGGEEFVVLLPRTTNDTALRVAEKLRRLVERTEFPGEAAVPGASLTVSIGVAGRDISDTEYGQLIERADSALYQAKREGRNRVQLC
jgi:diguanylate cyclase (GGDEF)-like protein